MSSFHGATRKRKTRIVVKLIVQHATPNKTANKAIKYQSIFYSVCISLSSTSRLAQAKHFHNSHVVAIVLHIKNLHQTRP